LPSTPSSAPPEAPASDQPAAPPSRRARALLAVGALLIVGIVALVTWLAVRGGDTSSASTPAPGSNPALDNLEQLGPSSEPGVAEVGDEAPDFALATLDGSTVRLSDFRGKPVVLNFWASWCAPCRREFPLLRATAQDAHGRYVVLGVSTSDIRSDARSFVRDEHATWTNGFDADNGVAKSFGVIGKPQTFFIDARGRIAARIPAELTEDLLARNLAKITRAR